MLHSNHIFMNSLNSFSYINNFLERREVNGQTVEPGWESRLDIESNDIIIQGNSSTRLSRKQVRISCYNSSNISKFISNESVSYAVTTCY